jgi:hypothetical protein
VLSSQRVLWPAATLLIGLVITVAFFAFTEGAFKNGGFLSHWPEIGPLILGPFILQALSLGLHTSRRIRSLVGVAGLIFLVPPAGYATYIAYNEMIQVWGRENGIAISGAQFIGVFALAFVMYPCSIVSLVSSILYRGTEVVTNTVTRNGIPGS